MWHRKTNYDLGPFDNGERVYLQIPSYEWLFLPKHKLELMFSSIEPCAPRGRTFPATFFLLFVPQTRTRIPAISYQPMKR